MTRFGYVIATVLAAEALGTLVFLKPLTVISPYLTWNASASVPIGFYGVKPAASAEVGDLVLINPPSDVGRFLDQRRYLPLGVPLLKHVAATAGMVACRRGTRISIGGKQVAVALVQDSRGRALPGWQGCRTLGKQEIFLLNAAPDSMDGRYFGVISTDGILGTASPLLTRDAPGAPLSWHGFRGSVAAARSSQGGRHD